MGVIALTLFNSWKIKDFQSIVQAGSKVWNTWAKRIVEHTHG